MTTHDVVAYGEEPELPLCPDISVSSDGLWIVNNPVKASSLAAGSGRPLMVSLVGGDWCPHCRKLEATVFSTEEFRSWAQQSNLVLLKLDFPHHCRLRTEVQFTNNELRKRWGVLGYPTTLFFSTPNLLLHPQNVGARENASEWIEMAKAALATGPSQGAVTAIP